MLLYTCEKFHNNNANGFQLTERTRAHNRSGYVQYSKGNKPELRFISSARRLSVLHLCEVSCKYLRRFLSYGADTNDGSDDGRTDTQNFGRYNIIPSQQVVRGIKRH